MQKKAEKDLFDPVLEKLEEGFIHSNHEDTIESRRKLVSETEHMLKLLEFEAGGLDTSLPESRRMKRHINKINNHIDKIDKEQRARHQRSIRSRRNKIIEIITKLYKRNIRNSDQNTVSVQNFTKEVDKHLKDANSNLSDEDLEDDDFFKDDPKKRKPVSLENQMKIQMLRK